MTQADNQDAEIPDTSSGGDDLPAGSLVDDLSALIEDGQTYLTAELAYQKTRLSFASGQGKAGAVFLLGALAFLHLALIALVVGLVFALAPVLTPLGATAAVFAVLLLLALMFVLAARKRIATIARAFEKDAS
ncbi:MAG: phage holin family protein [Sphingomonadaceae bacterium]